MNEGLPVFKKHASVTCGEIPRGVVDVSVITQLVAGTNHYSHI